MSLNQQAFDEINNALGKSNFSREPFYVIANFGLQIPAKEEDLFTNDNRVNPELPLNELKIRLKEFLFKHIR